VKRLSHPRGHGRLARVFHILAPFLNFLTGETPVPPGAPSARKPCLAILAAAALLAGCATLPREEPADPDQPVLAFADDIFGVISFVDPEEGIAVVTVRSTATRPSPTLVTRNEALVETARLEPTRFQRGRTLGTRILSGLPNVGDEVVVTDHFP